MPQFKKKASTPGSVRIINITGARHSLSPLRFHDYDFEGKGLPPDERSPATILLAALDPALNATI